MEYARRLLTGLPRTPSFLCSALRHPGVGEEARDGSVAMLPRRGGEVVDRKCFGGVEGDGCFIGFHCGCAILLAYHLGRGKEHLHLFGMTSQSRHRLSASTCEAKPKPHNIKKNLRPRHGGSAPLYDTGRDSPTF